MVVKSSLACGFQQCVGDLWMQEDFSDFTVIVEAASFKCHRFILSACSEFFRALFRSNMKESLEQVATIDGITKETFSVVLNSVYQGTDGLSESNMIDVWHASNQLQIAYILEECENFVMANMSKENCFTIFQHAKVLESERVIYFAETYISKNFEDIRHADSFYGLLPDEMYKLVCNQNLTVTSEDSVIEAIIKWVNYDPEVEDVHPEGEGSFAEEPNENQVTEIHDDRDSSLYECDNQTCSTDETNPHFQRIDSAFQAQEENAAKKRRLGFLSKTGTHHTSKGEHCLPTTSKPKNERRYHLKRLFSASRLYLVSADCLGKTLRLEMVMEEEEVHDLVLDALMYVTTLGRRHGSWPTSAVHRATGSQEHVMVFAEDNYIKCYSLAKGTVKTLANTYKTLYYSICVYDNTLFAKYREEDMRNSNDYFSVFTLTDSWKRIGGIPNSPKYLIGAGNNIYNFSSYSNFIERFCPERGHSDRWMDCKNLKNTLNTCIVSVVKFGECIIAFPTNTSEALDCHDTTTMTSWTLEPVDGLTDNVVSFSDDKNTYILQGNGTIMKILSSDPSDVNFLHITRVWNMVLHVCGAVLYRNQLFVFGKDEDKEPGSTIDWQGSLPGVFESVKIVVVRSRTQCLPFVVPGRCLQ